MAKNSILKYKNRSTGKLVSAMFYESINDFTTLKQFIGDVIPNITPAHTRIYENQWVIRTAEDNVMFMSCSHGDKCFEQAYELVR